MNNAHAIIVAFLTILGGATYAQTGERLLPVLVQVEVEGQQATGFTVTIYNGNSQEAQLAPSEFEACKLMLAINANYSIRISKPGMRDKLLSFDTHLPEGVEQYKPYPCVVSMESSNGEPDQALFADFPNAVIRWNTESHRFDHSDHYLEAIRSGRQASGDRLVHSRP